MNLSKLSNIFLRFAGGSKARRKAHGKGKSFLVSKIKKYSGPIDVLPSEGLASDIDNIIKAVDKLVDDLELDYRTYEIEARIKSSIGKGLRAIVLRPHFLPWTYAAVEDIRYDSVIVISWTIRVVQGKEVISLYCSLEDPANPLKGY
jgi:hypothetical protein